MGISILFDFHNRIILTEGLNIKIINGILVVQLTPSWNLQAQQYKGHQSLSKGREISHKALWICPSSHS